ncbi:hypothetical protein FRC02_004945 [Tulasnella sp. 418]|nr:hypothetical protein FRC02_004945 [Tulasnella sp. 418]
MFHLDEETAARPSPKDQVSMPFIKRHIRRRLINAKDTCDKELRKVVTSISEHVENRLREYQLIGTPPPSESPVLPHAHGHSHSSSITYTDDLTNDEDWGIIDSGKLSRRVSMSASSSPNSLKRHHGLPRTNSHSATSELSPGKPKQQQQPQQPAPIVPQSSAASYSQSNLSRRLSRNMHIPIMPSRSDSHSRSNSRSRSPLPPGASNTVDFGSSPRSGSIPSRRHSRFDLDPSSSHPTPDLFMNTLHEVIAIATDIIDTPISTLIAHPRTCAEFVQKVQNVGRAWDEHPDWQGRGWYVQLLLAVAGLSRVVEWWEAEKQFWNFEDDNDEDVEPLTFVLKPEDNTGHETSNADTISLGPSLLSHDYEDPSASTSTLDDRSSRREEGYRSRLSLVSQLGQETVPAPSEGPKLLDSQSARNSPAREISAERTRVPSPAPSVASAIPIPKEPLPTDTEPITTTPEKTRTQATEKLREQAEHAQTSNIVMEISLDSEQIMWANEAWLDVVGTNPEDLLGTAMSDLLLPADADVFKEAIRQLRDDASHTVEVHFKMRVDSGPSNSPSADDDDSQSTDSTTSAVPSSIQAPLATNPPQPKEGAFKKLFSPLLSHSPSSISLKQTQAQEQQLAPPLSRSASASANSSVSPSPSFPLLSLSRATLDNPPMSPVVLYREFEGKGMLMLDRILGTPSHTMWVIKPITPPLPLPCNAADFTGDLLGDPQSASAPGFYRRGSTDPVTPFLATRTISTQVILCRICEVGVPEWYFEKHSETCLEVHRLEAAIGEVNDSIQELRNTIRELSSALDKGSSSSGNSPATPGGSSSAPSTPSIPHSLEYRGMPIFPLTGSAPPSPGGSPSRLALHIGSPLQMFRPTLGGSKKKKQRLQAKQMQKALLETLDEILLSCWEISCPALREDQSDEPMERQRLLSPTSENKVLMVGTWKKPLSLMSSAGGAEDDPALSRLVQDVEMLMRTKLDNVKRMENTIKYSEKVRQEWEERVDQALQMEFAIEEVDEEEVEREEAAEGGENGADETQGVISPPDRTASQQSSTRSEYAFDGTEEVASTEDPTPMVATPPMAPSEQPVRPQTLEERSSEASTETNSSTATETVPSPTPTSGSPNLPQGLGVSNIPIPGAPQSTPSPTPSAGGTGSTSASAVPVPATYQGVGSHTRSSTPLSVTSPLALAPPLVAPMAREPTLYSSPEQLYQPTPHPPRHSVHSVLSNELSISPMPSLDGMAINEVPQTIRARRSGQNLGLLEPRVMVTPPVSPLNSPKELAPPQSAMTTGSTSSHSRKLSNVQPIVSPAGSVPPGGNGPLSPRLPSITPSSRTTPSSIKDFDIIKPISKGAFGAVFLAKKKTTGDYYAIKILKKADMIAKNQITNVKAERMIMMKQAESPFVVKLYFTFQSKDNLYLVMEYLNGGDCAALIKSLGSIPEEWTKAYVAEVTLGLEYLHKTGVVHRDLKPDNLLIDQHGHLKLTDFGLSRIGLLGRQTRDRLPVGPGLSGGSSVALDRMNSVDKGKKRHSPSSRHASMDSTYFASPALTDASVGSSYFNQKGAFANISTDDVSESSGSESLGGYLLSRPAGTAPNKNIESPLQSFAADLTNDLRSHSNSGIGTPPGEQKFVGTPDYLAPESILGVSEDDRTVDWWALGVITYEFLYGFPPFHDETPEKVFANIISRKIDWHKDVVDFSEEVMDFMDKLLQSDPKQRLGYHGAEEVKAHPFLRDIEWDKVTTTEAQFVPQVTDPESTDYFDPRGAIPQLFQDDEPVSVTGRPGDSPVDAPSLNRNSAASPLHDDFGTFAFKNLPVLKQANDDVIRKLKTDQSVAMSQTLSDPAVAIHRRRSVSTRKPQNVLTTNMDPRNLTNPPSPSTSTSSIASSPSRGSLPPSTPGSMSGHNRRPSEYGPIERFKQHHMDPDGTRRNSLPSRLRTSSMSSVETEPQMGDQWRHQTGTPATSVASSDIGKKPEEMMPPPPARPTPLERPDRAVTCLIADDNPISVKIMETLLTRMGCRCVLVHDGAEAISVALGDIKFDCIFMDYHMPIMDGETAARYIKSTNNKNTNTPIVSFSAYSVNENLGGGNLYAASLSKPVQKNDIINVMRQLGFKTAEGPKASKVVRQL